MICLQRLRLSIGKMLDYSTMTLFVPTPDQKKSLRQLIKFQYAEDNNVVALFELSMKKILNAFYNAIQQTWTKTQRKYDKKHLSTIWNTPGQNQGSNWVKLSG